MKKNAMVLFAVLILALCGGARTDIQYQKAAADKIPAAEQTQKAVTETALKAASKEPETAVIKVIMKTAGKEVKNKEKTQKPAVKATESESEKPIKKENGKEEKEKELPKYKVDAYEEPKVMYASNPVNVRKGPSTDFERVGGLNRAQEVTVTGQADTDWYEIVYGEAKGYVSDHYLQNEIPEEIPPQPTEGQPEQEQAPGQATQQVQAVTEVKNVAGVIMVGDSRFVQMQANIGENSCTWIAEDGKGYHWLNENAIARIDGCVGKGSKILINLGVNDPGNMKYYAELVNAKAAEWVGKGADVYYASVNPVWENPYVTEEQVEYFNSQLQGSLSGDIHWIDSHSYLDSIGYKLVDGLHFNSETYQNIYAYFMSCL